MEELYGFMWQYLKKQHWYVLISLLGTLGKVAVMIGLPTLLGLMIDGALISGDFERAITIGWWMLGLGVIGFIGRVINTYGSSRASSRMTEDIRNDVYELMKIGRASCRERWKITAGAEAVKKKKRNVRLDG